MIDKNNSNNDTIKKITAQFLIYQIIKITDIIEGQ